MFSLFRVVFFTVFSLFRVVFSCCIVVAVAKANLLKTPPLFRSQIFNVSKCCDIQGSHLIGYPRGSLIIDQSECLVCDFLCTELTLLCIELPENCIYHNQLEPSNFSGILLVDIYLFINRENRTPKKPSLVFICHLVAIV